MAHNQMLAGSGDHFMSAAKIAKNTGKIRSPISTVAPAQAGAYVAYRARLTDVMGPSLRWDDGDWEKLG